MKTRILLLLLITTLNNLYSQKSLISYETTENFIITNLSEYITDFTMNEEGQIYFFQIKKHEFNILAVGSKDNITIENSQDYSFINFNNKEKLIINKTEMAKRLLNAFRNYFELVEKNELDKESQKKEESQKKLGTLFIDPLVEVFSLEKKSIVQDANKATAKPTEETIIIKKNEASGFITLSWEKNNTGRKVWSDYTFQIIDSLFDNSFAMCEDIKRFRSDYDTLERKQKINVWGELISAICFHESGWKLNSLLEEKGLGMDVVTKQNVRSEGLLQLSYQDKINYSKLPCRFNWEIDKKLEGKDLKKTIFNYKYNLEFGINILANQIKIKKKIILDKGYYWAVLKESDQNLILSKISKSVESLKF